MENNEQTDYKTKLLFCFVNWNQALIFEFNELVEFKLRPHGPYH